MRVYLMPIGDEILIGQITDTNSTYMSGLLTGHGYEVVGGSVVPDAKAAIQNGLQHALQQAEIVILTGGLGPTKDDVTKTALADFWGCGMAFDPDTYARIEAYFGAIGRKVPDSMRNQATLPVLAVVLPNKVGSAPGMWFDVPGNRVVVSLPGVPWEMEYLMKEEVLPRLLAGWPGRPMAFRNIRTAGEGESGIAQRLEDFEQSLPANMKLAYLPSLGQVRLRLSAFGEGIRSVETQRALEALLDAQRARLHACIPDLVYGYEEQTLAGVVGDLLRQQGKTLATAESCTGGMLAGMITSIPGASEYFPGSIVSYSYEMKTSLLGVRQQTLDQFGAVSAETVREMVAGARQRLTSDMAVAISGIAGPGGGTPEKPVGTVWMAVGDGQRTVAQKHIFGRDREKNMALTCVYALNLIRRFLLGAV
jgi:nicotinamide-nucleotide amidase